MFCATCNLEYADHLNYCRRCGQTLVRALGERATESVCCTRCGARVVHGERFCQHCGTRVGVVTQETVIGVCQNCNTYWRDSWHFCKCCGVSREQTLQLNTASATQTTAKRTTDQPAAPASLNNCPHCNKSVQPFSLFCETCGMRLTQEPQDEVSPVSKKEAVLTKAKGEEADLLSRLDDPLLDDPLGQEASPISPIISSNVTSSSSSSVSVPVAQSVNTNYPAAVAPTVSAAAADPAFPALRLAEKQRETEAFPPVAQTAAQPIPTSPPRAAGNAKTQTVSEPKIESPPVVQSWRVAVTTESVAGEAHPTQPTHSEHSTRQNSFLFNEAGSPRRPFWHIPLLLGSILLSSFLLVGIWRKLQSAKVQQLTDATNQPAAVNGKTVSSPNIAPIPPAGMVYIPGGKYEMGRLDGTPQERPTRRLEIKAFFLDRTEVTNQQYLAFVQATGRRPPSHWRAGKPLPNEGNLPVVNVTWQDANDFAAWAGKRLPTEEEWEFAARGIDGRYYPWGKNWEAASANTAEGNANKIMEVGHYMGGASPFGVLDLCGNVWEWTSSQLRSYETQELIEEDVMVIRGGAYDSPKEFATTTYRGAVRLGKPYPKTGFRCARDLP